MNQSQVLDQHAGFGGELHVPRVHVPQYTHNRKNVIEVSNTK
jgi:hypothetical protein